MNTSGHFAVGALAALALTQSAASGGFAGYLADLTYEAKYDLPGANVHELVPFTTETVRLTTPAEYVDLAPLLGDDGMTFSVDLTDDQIVIGPFSRTDQWGLSTFDFVGLRFAFANLATPIAHATLNASTSGAAVDVLVDFTPAAISVNWRGLTLDAGTSITLDVVFDTDPSGSPPTIPAPDAGVSGLVLLSLAAMTRRRASGRADQV